MSRPIPTIVLAAGSSERFGGGKLTATVLGRSIIEWTLAIARHAARDGILVVLRPDSPAALRDAATATPATVVLAPDAHRGVAWSLRSGLLACDGQARGALIVLADDPLAVLELPWVLREARSRPRSPVAVRRRDGAPHPVYLPRSLWPGADPIEDDRGLQQVLQEARTTWLLPEHTATTVDVDEPADVARLAAALAAQGWRTD